MTKDYADGPWKYIDFQKYIPKDLQPDCIFGCCISSRVKDFSDFKYKILLENEEPNAYFINHPDYIDETNEKKWDKIITLCPYTTKWINNKYKNNRRIYAGWYPIEPDIYPINTTYDYDVCYAGSMPNAQCELHKTIDIISQYKYAYINFTGDGRSNFKNITSEKKLEIISKSKITIAYNLLFPTRGSHNLNYPDNEAFSHNDEFVVPQYKWRIAESMMCKSLILVRKDYWNLIENFYKPDEDFIYFSSLKDLKLKMDNILSNFDNYKHIIESAYNKTKNLYNTERFCKDIIINTLNILKEDNK